MDYLATLITGCYLHPADAFFPAAHAWAVDVTEGLAGQQQVDALWSDGELERNGLVSLRHVSKHSFTLKTDTD